MKKLLIGAVFLLFCTAWWNAVNGLTEKPALYREHIRKAEQFEEQEIYYDAILEYQNALAYSPENMDLYLKIARAYKNLGNIDGFEETCRTAIDLQEENEEAIFLLTDYYLEEGENEEAIALLKNQIEKKGESSALQEKLWSLAGGYKIISGEYDYISDSGKGCMQVAAEGKKGLLYENGKELIRPQYEEISFFGDNGFAAVKKDGESYFIDKNNYKRREPPEKYDYLGSISQGFIPAKKDGKWGYLNEDFQEVTEFVYEQVTPMLDGVAAVQKDGKWALIGEKLQRITDFEFSEIVTDDWGFCSRNGRVFVKNGDKYILIDNEGREIGEESFENVRPFLSQYGAAVQKDGKWGFISPEGKILLQFMYEDAKSFSDVGYAAVKEGGQWGYIKENGDFVIDPEFDDAKGFNSQGAAPVYTGGTWKLIQLDIY